ncbi:jg15894 [Pararge aegeria aegeria]|uniref:Jg15894 protein n=1 Tax=Pararge aegeria aegeria TaxID=348720 RepID=A0A8S4SPA8_9NEOP|nr:jg15894 [Pararge aegeria aegeria]
MTGTQIKKEGHIKWREKYRHTGVQIIQPDMDIIQPYMIVSAVRLFCAYPRPKDRTSLSREELTAVVTTSSAIDLPACFIC